MKNVFRAHQIKRAATPGSCAAKLFSRLEKVGKAENTEEVKKILEEAGIVIDDAELDQVVGGSGRSLVEQYINEHGGGSVIRLTGSRG